MHQPILFIFTSLLISACSVSSGIVALNYETYFQESQKIVVKKKRYFLRFRYAGHFYMSSSSEIKSDTLIFYIPATTSTADAQGKLQFEEIASRDKIKFINKQLVFWKNPDKKLIPLKIETIQEESSIPDIYLNSRKH